MNYNLPPFVQQYHCPFSFPQPPRGKDKIRKDRKVTDCNLSTMHITQSMIKNDE